MDASLLIFFAKGERETKRDKRERNNQRVKKEMNFMNL